MNVYEEAEALLRADLGKRKNRESCVKLALWLLRVHGPHGYARRFSVPRQQIHKARGCPDLTEAQIRGAVKALEEVGFLVRTTERFKKFKSCEDMPTLFIFGMTFAALFPAAKTAPQAHNMDGVRSTPHSNHNEESQGLEYKAPLIVATKDRPFGRPVIPRRPKTQADYKKALAEAQEARLAELAAQPLPKLSSAALASFSRRLW